MAVGVGQPPEGGLGQALHVVHEPEHLQGTGAARDGPGALGDLVPRGVVPQERGAELPEDQPGREVALVVGVRAGQASTARRSSGAAS